MNLRRRVLVGLLGFAVGKAMGASSIPKRKIGFLTSALSPSQREDDFRAGLRELGWIEGDNLVIEYRRAGNSPDRMAELAKDLVTRQVELIVAN